ncbi:MAG TPA: T9SS type A sorting domain-containing protein [Chitinophagales bacterium]|nr:T9SS type A sorting domain-containing protein [Chitinophagales bacterium]
MSHRILDGVADFDQNAFTVFPNPAERVVSIFCSGGLINAKVELIDMTGRTVLTQALSTNPLNTVDLSKLVGGIYRVRLLQDNRVTTETKLALVR